MNRMGQFFRLIKINYVLAKHGLDEIVLATRFFAPIRFIKYFNPWFWLRDKNASIGKRLRLALEELGPIFVKFGQTLSTRPDAIPQDIVDELEKLQDEVPPFSGAEKIIEQVYGFSLDKVFAEFDKTPLASASIAQVHAATLQNGDSVVVKVRRPNIVKTIRRDLGLLYSIAGLAEKYWTLGRRLHAIEVVEEFEKTILNELDLTREAANGSQLRRNFQDSELLYIPEIYWDLTREQVMVMERIHGIPVADIQTLRDYNVDMKKLAERGVEIFFTQVFRDSFFHADMHPGNIFVSYKTPRSPQYIAVDYGIVGTLSKSDQRYLAENMLAFFQRDYQRIAELHLESGWIPADTRVTDFESAIRTVCEPIFERPLKDISFGSLLLRLFQVGKRFHMEVQPQLILLQKTLLHIEGLGRRLYPELDLWQTAKPFLEEWIQKKIGPKAMLQKIRRQLPYILEKLPEIPELAYQRLQQPRSTTRTIIDRRHIETKKNNGAFFGIGITLLAAGVVSYLLSHNLLHPNFTLSESTWYIGGAGVLALVIAAWPRSKP